MTKKMGLNGIAFAWLAVMLSGIAPAFAEEVADPSCATISSQDQKASTATEDSKEKESKEEEKSRKAK